MNDLLLNSLNAIVSAYNNNKKDLAYKILELTCKEFLIEGKIEQMKNELEYYKKDKTA